MPLSVGCDLWGGEKKMSKMQFEIVYCAMCESNCVICPKCGNNTCNGGSGYLDEHGHPTDDWNNAAGRCDVCPLAYQYDVDAVHGGRPPIAPRQICLAEKELWEEAGTSTKGGNDGEK